MRNSPAERVAGQCGCVTLTRNNAPDAACFSRFAIEQFGMLSTFHYHAWRRIRAAYYQFDLARMPFGTNLGRAVSAWEQARGFGDSPKDKSRWDEEYSDGRWAYIRKPNENSRYWILIGYMERFRGSGNFLEIGCGDGLLFRTFKPLGYQRYVGFDISDVAIDALRDQNDARTEFVQANGDTHEPGGEFDVIVLNESLYYLNDPVNALERYAGVLTPDGCIVLSTYMASRRSLSVLRSVKHAFEVVDETRISHGAMSWLCTVLVRSKRRVVAFFIGVNASYASYSLLMADVL